MDVQNMVLEMRRAGLSQSEIARRVDCSQVTIGRIEHGNTDPRLSLVQRIESLYKSLKPKKSA